MAYVTGYITALIVFGAIDAIWLSLMGPALYRPTLGDILLTDLRVAPAIAFYAIYPIGLVVFAVMPGLKSGSSVSAIGLAALFGGDRLRHLRPDQLRNAAQLDTPDHGARRCLWRRGPRRLRPSSAFGSFRAVSNG